MSVITVKAVYKDMESKDGTPFRSPRYRVVAEEGGSWTTFDGKVGQAAELLRGHKAEVTIEEKNGYKNLAAIQPADSSVGVVVPVASTDTVAVLIRIADALEKIAGRS